MAADNPTVLRSVAVRTDDVVLAIEANARRETGVVLRVTPPFSGRMRARLHVEPPASAALDAGTEPVASPVHTDEPLSEPLTIEPVQFVDTVPPFPTPDDTEDDLRADPDVAYSPAHHRQRHAAAVEAWRSAVADRIVDRMVVQTDAGPHEIDVKILG